MGAFNGIGRAFGDKKALVLRVQPPPPMNALLFKKPNGPNFKQTLPEMLLKPLPTPIFLATSLLRPYHANLGVPTPTLIRRRTFMA